MIEGGKYESLCCILQLYSSLCSWSSTSSTSLKFRRRTERSCRKLIVLGPEAKLGTIKFSHVDHMTKNRSIEGSKIDLHRMSPHGATCRRSCQTSSAENSVARGPDDYFDCRAVRERSECGRCGCLSRLSCASRHETEALAGNSANQAWKSALSWSR